MSGLFHFTLVRRGTHLLPDRPQEVLARFYSPFPTDGACFVCLLKCRRMRIHIHAHIHIHMCIIYYMFVYVHIYIYIYIYKEREREIERERKRERERCLRLGRFAQTDVEPLLKPHTLWIEIINNNIYIYIYIYIW